MVDAVRSQNLSARLAVHEIAQLHKIAFCRFPPTQVLKATLREPMLRGNYAGGGLESCSHPNAASGTTAMISLKCARSIVPSARERYWKKPTRNTSTARRSWRFAITCAQCT